MANRFVLKFSKRGYARYTSHLDMLNVFKRAFRSGGVALRYSQGFNPHPRMSFAQPLSLGYGSSCELLEFETESGQTFAAESGQTAEEILSRLAGRLPQGIELLGCQALAEGTPSLAAAAESADYTVTIPLLMKRDELQAAAAGYLAQEHIETEKRRKKDKKMVTVDIKGMIRSFRAETDGNGRIFLFLCLDCGSASNCSPELVIASFLGYLGADVSRAVIDVERTAIKFVNNLHF